jgi:hypothetical protein
MPSSEIPGVIAVSESIASGATADAFNVSFTF